MGKRYAIAVSAVALSAIALASCTGQGVIPEPVQADEQVVKVVDRTPEPVQADEQAVKVVDPIPAPLAVPTPSPTPFPSFSYPTDAEDNLLTCMKLVQLKEDAEDLEWCISTFFGQPNLKETMVNRIVPNRTFHIGGVHVDTSTEPNRIYVLDSGNNRILGFDSTEMSPDREADIVIGQPSAYDSGTCNGDNTQYLNPTANTLCFQPYPEVPSTLESGRSSQMATDSEGNLYVLDLANNRVLKYLKPFETDTIADDVWGQDSFTERACNRGEDHPDDDTLCTEWPSRFSNSDTQVFTAGVDIDSEGNLWVADTANHRVLRFPKGEKHADLVLGQEDFTSRESDCRTAEDMKIEWLQENKGYSKKGILDDIFFTLPMDKMCKPNAVRVHHETGDLYVLEGEWPGRARVLAFEPQFRTGMYADRELGVGSAKDSWSGLNFPRGMAIDTTGQGEVWVADVHLSRVVLLDRNGNIIKMVGPDEPVSHYNQEGTRFTLPDGEDETFNFPNGEVSFDSEGNLYAPEAWQTSYVVRFPLEELLQGDTELKSDGVLLYKGWNQTTGLTLRNTHGFALSEGQLIVSDRYKLLVWDDYLTAEPGAHADRVIGQDDFESFGDNGIHVLGAQTLDDEGRIWISDFHKIYVFQTPFRGSGHTGDEDEPVAILESKESFFWADTDEPVEFELGGVAYDAENNALWLVDWPRNRVLHVHDPLGDHPTVDMVIGQPDRPDRSERGDRKFCNAGKGYDTPSPYGLCSPRFVTLDNDGNLYIVDGSFELNGNRRVLEFDAERLVPEPDNIFPLPRANRVFAKPNFYTRECEEDQPCNPTWAAFDSQGHMVMTVDGYGNPQYQKVFIYLNPLEDQKPDYVFPLAFGQAAVAQFDSLDNLVLQDHTWNRILVIRKPFAPNDD